MITTNSLLLFTLRTLVYTILLRKYSTKYFLLLSFYFSTLVYTILLRKYSTKYFFITITYY